MEQELREKLEEAYEEEKKKSIIVKKCNRVYNQILKN